MASRPDAAAAAALAAQVRRPVTFAWLDILGESIRVTNAPYSFALSSTGDPDLDGYTFTAVDPQFVSVSSVKRKEDGTDTVVMTLSGLASVDDELMTAIGNKANWQGRACRLWRAMLNPDDPSQILSIWSYYTGYMTVPKIPGDKTGQTITLEVESYLSMLTRPSNRTYLDQRAFDPDDWSADLAVAAGNGAGQPKK